MRNDVQEHFLSRHCSCITVSETESDAFLQLARAGLTGVALLPGIRLGHRELQFIQPRGRIRVRRRVAMLLSKQVRLEDSIDHVDMVKHAYGAVQCVGVLLSGDCRQYVEQFVVRPGFLRKEGGNRVYGLADGRVYWRASSGVHRRAAPGRVRWRGELEAVASRRSANQTLITDCLVTPSLLASRSRESIIQVGKSTFTRFCTCNTRLALDKSKEAVISTPSSNCCSNFLAFIKCYLFCACPTHGYQSDIGPSVGNNGRPMLPTNQPDHQIPRLIICK